MAAIRLVYVVDDEPVIATTMAAILRRQGYEVKQFTNPLKALEAFERECPDLLISDVMMPGLTGVELAIRVRFLCPFCRIVLISGQASTCDLLSAARLGGHDFQLLDKPIAPPHLLAILQQPFIEPGLPFD